jgi:hypothetical protein
MLSRWLLGMYPSLTDELVRVEQVVPSGVGRRIRRTLRALDLLAAAPDGDQYP